MSDNIKAEKIAKHFAGAVSPRYQETPYGKRTAPTVSLVDFSNSIDVANTAAIRRDWKRPDLYSCRRPG